MIRCAWLSCPLSVLGLALGCDPVDLYAVTGENPDDASTDTDAGVDTADTADTATDPGPCSGDATPPGDTSMTVRVGTVDRTYVLHVPSTYDGTSLAPLIVDFHGIGSSGWGELSASPYPAVTDADGVIMAFPDGKAGPIGTAWNMGPCCVANVDDLAFSRALVEQVKTTACIDPDRIYAVGVLTGGGMVYSLACHMADVFAAVAPASFDLVEEMLPDCAPSRPISVISFRATQDTRVPYDGGASSLVPGMPVTFLGAQGTFEQWASIDGCKDMASSADENGCVRHLDCAQGVEVVLCTDEGGREGPGDASVAWPLLQSHTL